MIRRKKVIPPRREKQPEMSLLGEILANVNLSWAEACRGDNLDAITKDESGPLLVYLENVLENTRLFIPARDPSYGISERGGDAILGYLRNRCDDGAYFFFADVSGFTALLTSLTERFGKEEAGDIVNLSILNRFCLNKMGLVLDHFKDEDHEGDRAMAAFKVMLSIRAAMPLVTREVREELRRKLLGKPHQDEIEEFISELLVRESGGLIFDPRPRSDFYGNRVRSRITWGATGKLVALAEKLGGSDDPVCGEVEEVKGFGIDQHCYSRLNGLFEQKWLDLEPSDLVISEPVGAFRKLVIAPSGMEKIGEFVEDLCARGFKQGKSVKEAVAKLDLEAKKKRIRKIANQIFEVEKYIGSRLLLLHIVRNLGHEGNKNILLDESCSAVRDSGVLFCNFEISSEKVLNSLADEVHRVMARYGIHYKYNIFHKGDFNLMGVLGTMFSEKRESDRYYAEILWNAWRDLRESLGRTLGSEVKIRGGMSVGKGLQGPAGDNIVNNEETIIGPDCNLAARLVDEALETDSSGNIVNPSGTIFTIESHCRKVEHLIQPASAVREANLKGFSKPVALYSLTERKVVESISEFIARLRKVPLVTVEGEVVQDFEDMRKCRFLAKCMDLIEQVADGRRERSQIMAFVARSGVGKTRRIAELVHWALERGWPVYFGECYSWYQGEGTVAKRAGKVDAEQTESHSDEGAYPYYPFIRILKEQIFRINNQDPPELKRDKIAEVLSMLDPSDPELAEQAPVIASFIGVEVPETGFSSALDSEARRNIFYKRTGDIFAREVERGGPGSTVLLCIDDLQWSDRNSLHLLNYILRRVNKGLVVCVNARKAIQLGILRDKNLLAERHILKPGLLKLPAIKTLANLVLGIDSEDYESDMPGELKTRIEKELEANPFFVIEFCNKILEQEIVTIADGKCTRFNSESFRHVSIPTRIQGVIEDRISRLSKEEHVAIQYSSVLGNILRYIIIRRFLPVADRDNLFKHTDLEEVFSRLTGYEITRLENEKDPDWVYTFKRALIGEKLYQELVPSMRKRLHQGVAKVFENTELANKFEKALLTALHYSSAEIPEKSCAYYLEAGELAREVFDNEKSLMLLDRIEKILSEYRVEDAERRRMSMLENRGQVNLLLGHYDKALEDFENLASMASSKGEDELETRARHLEGKTYFQRSRKGDFDRAIEHFSLAADKLKDGLLLSEILNDRARTHLEKGERDEALKYLNKAEHIFTRVAGSPLSVEECIFKAFLLRNRGSVFHRRGEFSRAVEIYRDALELVKDEAEPRLKKIRAMLLNSIGLSLMKAFKLEESLQYFNQALKLASSIGDLKTEIQVRINLGVVDNDMGRNQEALETLSAQHDTLEVLVGETRELAALQFNIGESYMFLEKYEESEPWYRRALSIGESIGYKEFVVGTRYNLAEVLHITARSTEALEALEPAYDMAREGGWNLQLMDISNLLGEIHRENGKFSQARQYHEKALKISRKLKDDFGKSWALRNLALDMMEDPESDPAKAESCRQLLEESVELARKAGQPENLMHSLRELIRWELDNQQDPRDAAPLYEELKAQADKVGSRSFSEFCQSVRNRLAGKRY